MRRPSPPSPLPQRHGLDAMRMRTPATAPDGAPAPWPTMRDHLVARLPRVPPERIAELLRDGRIVTREGAVGLDTPYAPGVSLWMHRDLPEETPVPFPVVVRHRDERIVVVDKPHFLATIPRGRHVVETVLVRLRRELDLPELSPAHRLDRTTAGLLLLVVSRTHRGAYQTLFRDRRVQKTYEAVAAVDPDLHLPRRVRSRIEKERGVLQAREVVGPVNAETDVALLSRTAGGLGHYQLTPHTGRTHQLRLHMAGLGLPILGDDLYPDVVERPADDFARPLQLLATRLAFVDPLTGHEREFRTARRLDALTDPDRWSSGPEQRR